LPQLGEQALYDQLDFSSTPLAEKNAVIGGAVVSVFQCPSTPGSPRSVFSIWPPAMGLATGSSGLGATDYSHVCFVGLNEEKDHHAISAKQLPGAWYGLARFEFVGIKGPLDQSGARGSASLRYIMDGLSTTILVAEKAGWPNSYRNREVVEPSPYGGGMWAASEMGGFGKAKVNWANWPSVYSFHSSGSYVGVCDGAVRWLGEETDEDVVTALCSRDGAEAK
jgi:hypothetical protein